MDPYKEQFPVGTNVRIAAREQLEDFKRTWRFHHPLEAEQLSFAGRDATVQKVGFYHGGDALYSLEGIPGIWHEQCLSGSSTQHAAISKRHVMPLLLQACPGFEPMWREHLEWWHGEEPGIFNDTDEFGRYLVESYGRGETAEFEQAFATVERIIRDGDDDARGAATVGVLESVQVQSTHHPFGPEPFLHWLGPLSRQAWSEIEELWSAGGGSLAGVIRVEAQAQDVVRGRRWWQFWK